jgi:hypothetical protein
MGLIELVTLDVYSTRPVCVLLVGPLFACGGKRGFEKVEKLLALFPAKLKREPTSGALSG